MTGTPSKIQPGANSHKTFFCLGFTDFRTKLECLLDSTGKAYQRQTLLLITKIRNLWTKKFYNIGPRTQCYKTVYIYNLPILIKLDCLFLTRPFQTGLIFVG
jgi:hypothetical protein